MADYCCRPCRINSLRPSDAIYHLGPKSTLIQAMSLIAKFMGPTWGPCGAGRTHMGPMLATWTWCIFSTMLGFQSTQAHLHINSLQSSFVIWHQRSRSFCSGLNVLTHWGWVTHRYVSRSLVKIKACCLFSTKPLSEPMMSYCQLDHNE